MTHIVRVVAAAALLTALVLYVSVQAQTPDIDALRARAQQGDAIAQVQLWALYSTGVAVPQDDAEAVRWFRLAASRMTGELRDSAVSSRDLIASLLTPAALNEAQRLAREWDAAHPR